MQQKSPRNSEALSYGCIYPFWKLTRIMHRFFCMVNCFSKNHQKHADGDNKKRVSHSVNDFPYRQKRHKIFSFCPFRQQLRIGVGHHFAPLVLLMMDLRCCARSTACRPFRAMNLLPARLDGSRCGSSSFVQQFLHDNRHSRLVDILPRLKAGDSYGVRAQVP